MVKAERSATLTALRHRFRLVSDVSPERWRDGPGQLVGGLPAKAVEACFCPQAAGTGGQHPERGYNCNPSARRVFTGRGWGDVLAIPYYDLPERLSAYLFVGRRGERSQGDVVFRPVRHGFVRGGAHEAGLAWLPTLLRQRTSRPLVALADALLALRLQVRHSRMSLHLLPLLAWYDGPEARTTAAAWRALEGWPVVFWAWRLEAQVLHQAIQAGGDLALAGPQELRHRSLEAYLRRQPPADLVQLVWKQAQPWRQALRDWVDRHPDGAVEDLFLRLLPYGHSLQGLCSELGRPERLVRLLERPGRERVARIGRVTVIEHDGCWYAGASQRRRDLALIADVILRLDGVSLKEQHRVYAGRILYQGEAIPFADVPATTVETKKVVPWLRQVLLASGRGLPRYYGHHFGITLFEAALAFQAPQVGPPGSDAG